MSLFHLSFPLFHYLPYLVVDLCHCHPPCWPVSCKDYLPSIWQRMPHKLPLSCVGPVLPAGKHSVNNKDSPPTSIPPANTASDCGCGLGLQAKPEALNPGLCSDEWVFHVCATRTPSLQSSINTHTSNCWTILVFRWYSLTTLLNEKVKLPFYCLNC